MRTRVDELIDEIIDKDARIAELITQSALDAERLLDAERRAGAHFITQELLKRKEEENQRLRLSADTWNRAFYDEAELRRELTAENARLRELHRRNVHEDSHSRIMRSSHFCEWRTSFEAVIERSKAALLGGGG